MSTRWTWRAPNGSTTFESVQKAQELTQYNINKNSQEIQDWLKGPPPPTNSDRPKSFDSTAPNGETSGRSVTKQPDPNDPGTGFKDHGLNAKAVPVTGFAILTSMPTG
ncbi:RNase A-like domain-containing protein [Streptomyces sp. NPDC021093]|uniref:RNase A-like domain-containing protein n=1 Tax=Streptomyces sp. NPDC021093 TaxID=3365112 RepID=UPI003788FC70